MENLTKVRKSIGVLVVSIGLALSLFAPAWGQDLGERFELSFSTGGLLEDVLIDDATFPQTFLSGLALGAGLPATNPVTAIAEFDLDPGYTYLFSVLCNFTKHFGGELTFGGATSNIGGDVTGEIIIDPTLPTVPVHASYSFDNNLFILNGDLVVRLPLGNFAPFLTVGAGVVYFGGELRRAFVDIMGETELETEEIDRAGFVALGVDQGLLEFSETSFQWSFGGGLKYYVGGGFLLQVEVKDHVVSDPAQEFFKEFEDTETLHLIEVTGGIGVAF